MSAMNRSRAGRWPDPVSLARRLEGSRQPRREVEPADDHRDEDADVSVIVVGPSRA